MQRLSLVLLRSQPQPAAEVVAVMEQQEPLSQVEAVLEPKLRQQLTVQPLANQQLQQLA
jgi:hypothetical protein